MAASKIKVNTTTLKKDTDSIEQVLKNIEKKIKEMQTAVNALNGMWEGEANASFNQAFQDDITDLKSICDSLKELVRYEQNAKKEYDSCEARVSDLIDQITV